MSKDKKIDADQRSLKYDKETRGADHRFDREGHVGLLSLTPFDTL